jgi:hypothetical protein
MFERAMKKEILRSKSVGVIAAMTILILGSFVDAALAKKEKEPPQETHDGLELLPDRKAALVYVKPGADFSGYDKVMILDVFVAFQKGWENQQRATSVYKVTPHDIQKIKEATAELFREVFTEALTADDGYPLVESADTDVLLLRPAIIDLEVTAPESPASGRTYNFASSAGAATLFLELYDSVSGEIRAIDRQVADYPGDLMRYSNRVINREAARKVLAGWATLLRERLDEIHRESASQPEVVAKAVADLAGRLGIGLGSIEVRGFEAVTWPDGSLGCPQEGMMYAQVLTEGSRIDLAVGDRVYAYHAARGGEPFLCETDEGERD